MGIHVMAEGAVVSCRSIPMCPKPVQSFRGKSGGGSGMSTTIVVQESSTSRVWYLVMVQRVGKCIYEQE
jgi:hypothetical protein